MQYDVTSPEEYLAAIDDDWRKDKILELRTIILNTEDDIEEVIDYKMLAYADTNGIFCHLNAQKNYVGLYVGDAQKIDDDGSLLEGLNCGKGCVRFKKSNDASSDKIKVFIAKTVQLWKDGVDVSCFKHHILTRTFWCRILLTRGYFSYFQLNKMKKLWLI